MDSYWRRVSKFNGEHSLNYSKENGLADNNAVQIIHTMNLFGLLQNMELQE